MGHRSSWRGTLPSADGSPEGFSGSRRARRHRVVAVLAAVMLTVPVAGGLLGGAASADSGVPFVPYIDVTLWPPPDLTSIAEQSGVDEFTLAFVQSNGTCSPHWGGITKLADDFMGPQIDALRAAGGDVIISFGGAAGIELGEACADEESLAAAYASVADHYDVHRLDFDIEGSAVAKPDSVEMRSRALARMQTDQAAAGKPVEVSLTLPVLPTGLTADGLNVVRSARDNGVDVSVVNIMAMDYGSWAAPNPEGRMGEYGKQAAQSVHDQLVAVFPDRTDTQIWQMVGITPMIGQNDVAGERLSATEAADIRAFAVSKGAGRLAMWSVHRDKPCPGGPSQWASATCSGVDEAQWAFSSAFTGRPMPDPGTTTTTVPGSTTTTAAPATTTTSAPTRPSELSARLTVTTDWGSGYCAEAKVTNTTPAPADWTSEFDLPGAADTVNSHWSAVFDRSTSPITASGVSWNDVLDPGASTTFGFCATRSSGPTTTTTTTVKPTTTTTTTVPTTTTTAPSTTTTVKPTTTTSVPGGGVGASTTITQDWGSGYCAEVKVTNGGSTSATWQVTVGVQGRISSLWDAQGSQSGQSLSARGMFWNANLAAGASTTFGYCATV